MFFYLLHTDQLSILYILSVNCKIEKMSEFLLTAQFLKNDMDRIDNPKHFMLDFECCELIKYFSEIVTLKDIMEKRNLINLFYDRFIAFTVMNRSLYTQLKWIIVMHQIIKSFKQNTPLYGFTLKALQVSLESVIKQQNRFGPYERYLSDNLVKPYIQFLCKLCLLSMPEETTKYDFNSAQELDTKPQQQTSPTFQKQTSVQKQDSEKQKISLKLVDWYRRYNFIMSTLETLDPILTDTHRFFKTSFPFLNSISKFIAQDLNNVIFKLKYMYRSLKKSNVTIIELDQLQNKLKLFSSKSNEISDNLGNELVSKIQDLQQFLFSPLKPSQLKLYSKKSVGTPLTNFINT